MATPTGIEAKVCADIARRQQAGIAKYGTSVAANRLPLKAWLQHAYEEALDLAIYLHRALEEIESPAPPPPGQCFVCGSRHHHLIGLPPQCPSCYGDNG